MDTKVFSFVVEVEAVPYCPKTVECLFGEDGQYNADYPEDIIAHDIISEMVKDAIVYCLRMKMEFLAKTGKEPKDMNECDKAFWYSMELKEKQYRKIEKTIRSIQ